MAEAPHISRLFRTAVETFYEKPLEECSTAEIDEAMGCMREAVEADLGAQRAEAEKRLAAHPSDAVRKLYAALREQVAVEQAAESAHRAAVIGHVMSEVERLQRRN